MNSKQDQNNINYAELTRLVISDQTDGAENGHRNWIPGYSASISADGTVAIVGVIVGTYGNCIGYAYIFAKDGNDWVQQAKLRPSVEEDGGDFGVSVALSADGSTAIVGSVTDRTNRGSAYIFTRNGSSWTQQIKLVADDEGEYDEFGWAVAISDDGNTAVVGACGDECSAGSAYVFTRTKANWTQQAKLISDNRAAKHYFGESVAVSGDGNTVIVGAHSDDFGRGSVYVFTKDGNDWTQHVKLVASDGLPGNRFGYSVSISTDGNTAIVGSNDRDFNRGSVYIFTRNGSSWAQQSRFLGYGPVVSGYYGFSTTISADGNTAVIGAYADDGDKGSVYVFAKDGNDWVQKKKLTDAERLKSGWFGHAVAVSGDGNTIIALRNKDFDKVCIHVFTKTE